jgi:hypothetical protein
MTTTNTSTTTTCNETNTAVFDRDEYVSFATT